MSILHTRAATAMMAVLLAGVLVACAGTETQKSAGEYVEDTVISTKVEAALIQSDIVEAREVNVDTYKGVVQLSGLVNSESEKELAGKIASGIEGVKDVDNTIRVHATTD